MPSLDTSTLRIDPTQPLWTLEQAAAYLGVSPRYFRELGIPSVRLPGRGPRRQALVRYIPSVVAAWAEQWRTDDQEPREAAA